MCGRAGGEGGRGEEVTNYECYFGTQERAMDTLANLMEYPYDHPRKEVRELYDEIRNIGPIRWLKSECANQRWWAGIPLKNKP